MLDWERSAKNEVIYNNVDTVGHLDLRIAEKQQPLQHTGSVSVKNRKHRAAEVCLRLLCFLLLTAVIVLCVCLTSERKQLLTHISNLTEERQKILTKYERILIHNNNLTEERQKILTKYERILIHNNNLTEERQKILTKYERILIHNNNLTEESEKLKNDKNRLHTWLYEQDQRADNFKWIYYNFSFYYISSERKSWSYSRQDCHQRGADLVIINSRGEQDFLQRFAVSEYFWVSLIKIEGLWKWIDGTTMAHRSWTDSCNCGILGASMIQCYHCDFTYRWICERTFRIIYP